MRWYRECRGLLVIEEDTFRYNYDDTPMQCTAIFPAFQRKNLEKKNIFAQHIDCGYTLVLTGTNDLCFKAKIRKFCILNKKRKLKHTLFSNISKNTCPMKINFTSN